jgi:hypothetical protein
MIELHLLALVCWFRSVGRSQDQDDYEGRREGFHIRDLQWRPVHIRGVNASAGGAMRDILRRNQIVAAGI